MHFAKSSVLTGIVLCVLSSASSAQQLDRKQILLIRETASAICNTVHEAKGTKSTLQLELDVGARLTGLLGKMAEVGGSTKGDLTKEEFEGLSREATATALGEDRHCRERVFNKMFDKLEKLPDKSTQYKKNGRRSDLRAVQSFMRTAPITVARARPEYVCQSSDTDDYTREIRFSDKTLSVVNWSEHSGERCKSGYMAVREETQTCSAEIRNLDDVIHVWSPPMLTINCLTGDCISCSEQSKWKNKHNPNWTPESRQFKIDYMKVYVGGRDYVQSNRKRFKDAVRALARLISGGSDKAFCNYSPQYC